MGTHDLAEMDVGTMDESGRSLTQAGRIIGMIISISTLLFVVDWVLIIAMAVMAIAR